MDHIELKIARMRRQISGREAADALGLTVDGYFKKEHGGAGVTLTDAFTLTKLFQLTLTEFVNIFYNGDLPFLQERREDYKFSEEAFPLKAARERAGYSEAEAALALGIPKSAYVQREKGRVRISLEQSYKLSKLYGLTLAEFNDVFFRSGLPFRNGDAVPYTRIIPQEAGGINAEKGYESRV